jgi:hypothetical protein
MMASYKQFFITLEEGGMDIDNQIIAVRGLLLVETDTLLRDDAFMHWVAKNQQAIMKWSDDKARSFI